MTLLRLGNGDLSYKNTTMNLTTVLVEMATFIMVDILSLFAFCKVYKPPMSSLAAHYPVLVYLLSSLVLVFEIALGTALSLESSCSSFGIT